MAKLTARGAREIRRWVKPHGETLVLTQEPNGRGRTRLLRKWTSGASYQACAIPVHRPGVRPMYTERPTVEEAELWAAQTGWEKTQARR